MEGGDPVQMNGRQHFNINSIFMKITLKEPLVQQELKNKSNFVIKDQSENAESVRRLSPENNIRKDENYYAVQAPKLKKRDLFAVNDSSAQNGN